MNPSSLYDLCLLLPCDVLQLRARAGLLLLLPFPLLQTPTRRPLAEVFARQKQPSSLQLYWWRMLQVFWTLQHSIIAVKLMESQVSGEQLYQLNPHSAKRFP